jgi:predicted lipoprotein
MKEPYDAQDPKIVESPFSGNSAVDFKNNIAGAYAVYTCKFLSNEGQGLNKLVAAKNISLDNEIQQKFTAAITAFNSITVPYEQAIISQRVQCQNVMNAIEDLKTTLDEKLKPFIQTNITD